MSHLPTASFALHLPPDELLRCPKCAADTHSGLQPQQQRCLGCGTQFFDLGGMPAWFCNGFEQKSRWNNLLSHSLQSVVQNLALHRQLGQQVDLLPATRERLNTIEAGLVQLMTSISQVFSQAGLSPQHNPDAPAPQGNGLMHYFELVLRDWAWEAAAADATESENEAAWRRVETALVASGGTASLGKVLVLGAGAGRLSWDLHRHCRPDLSLAVDFNPLLTYIAHHLVNHRAHLSLTELYANPQWGLPQQKLWHLQAPDTDKNKGWHVMAADAWNLPLAAGQFDLVLTPWFVDVSGRDIRQLIATVSRLLKPGGRWLNTGPLLYNGVPPEAQYSHGEIIELVRLGGFSMAHQSFEQVNFLQSPLSTQTRTEQVWTFAALAPERLEGGARAASMPAWLLLPHLPIPLGEPLDTQNQPVLEHLVSLIDGTTCLHDLAAHMAENLGSQQEALLLAKQIFAQMLSSAH